ncbi:MAG: SLBB domain-containing protein [Chloroflexi bacterium]|nr:SLBB domain-containing protein [Chloroflexota bacterium]
MATYAELKAKADERWQTLAHGDRAWVRVGTAICGKAAGASLVVESLKAELSRRGVQAHLSEVGCLGLCYAEPIVDILKPGKPRVFFKNVTPDQVPELVESYLIHDNPKNDSVLGYLGEGSLDGVSPLDQLSTMKKQIRIALRNAGHIDPLDIYQYIANGGYAGLNKALFELKPQQVAEEVTKSGLRGRGGAAFPTGTKWSFLARTPGTTKYMLCNCEEGDPGAYNDKGILESDPHTLIEGMIIGGYATESNYGYIFIRHGHEGPIERTEKALEQAYEAGLLGQNILGSGFSFDIEVSLTGDSYVSGEETALMESIEGKRAMPRYRPPFPAQSGLWGKPSNINNVKTLAYVPEIITRGGDWFAGIGVGRSKGTVILCLSGNITYPGMYEIPMGMTLRQVLEDVGGGVPNGKKLKLLQTGGPLGGVLSGDKIDIALDFEQMAQAGAILGSGGIIVADEDTCAVDMARVLVAFCQFESCGKCFPCRLGMTHLLEVLERISNCQTRPGDMELMQGIGRSMTLGSLCGHGQLGFNPVQSAFRYFAEDFEAHMKKGRCLTGQCTGLHITPTRTRP